MKPRIPSPLPASLLPAVTAALAAAGLLTTAQAQVQTAGTLLVSVDATAASTGALSSIANAGSLGGFFEARGGGATVPIVANVHGNGTKGIQCDGGQYMQLVATLGGAPMAPPAGIVDANPDYSIEAWVMNPVIQGEETVVSWGKRGGPDGSNCSFNYGYDAAWGAMGHWGGADIGWDSSAGGSGVYPPGVPVPGVWHHLVYTFDGATQRVYADGVQKNTEGVSLNITSGTSINLAAQLEADGVTVTGGLRGSMTIARLRIHDGTLSGAQVSNNYNFERGDFAIGGAPLTMGPTHRYSFNNTAGGAPDGSVVTDSTGGANGVVRGAGATFTGSRVTIPGGASLTAAYVDLPNNLVSTNSVGNGGSGEVTLETWVKITGTRSWGRIFDAGSSDGGEVIGPGGGNVGTDYLMWSAHVGTDIANQRIELRNEDPGGGGIATVDHPTASQITTPRDIHVALSWKESTGQLVAYENGSQVSVLTVPGGMPMSALHDVNVWLGRSNWAGDANAQGEYDEFRVYNKVLSAAQVQASYQAGPNNIATADPVMITTQPQHTTATELGFATFTVSASGQIPITYQWYKNSMLAAGATNTSYTVGPLSLADNLSTVYCIASNNLFSTPYTATSSVVTLTVQPDLTPPAIARARVASSNKVEVIFSEAVNGTDAANAARYTVRGPEGPFTILGAVALAADRAVLTLASNLACAFYTVTATNIHDVASAMNPSASSAGFWNFTPPSMTHRYTFNAAPAANATGAAVPDLIGAADGTVLNASGTTSFSGDKLSLSGGPSATSPYVDLPNQLLSNNSTNRGGTGQLSFEGWVKVTGVRNWGRILDFGASGGLEVFSPGGGGNGNDYFFYSAMNGTDRNRRRLDKTGSGHDAGVEYGISNFGQDFHYAITWDEASGVVRVYEDGVLAGSMTTAGAMSEVNDVNVWLGRSNWSVDENTQGDYDEFRIYNRVISTNDILRNRAAGPDMGLGAPSNFDLVVTNHSMFTNTVRRVPVLVTFANAGRRDIADSGCVAYESTDANVVTVSADGVLLAHNVGTATVTARFSGLSDSEVINVSADTIPPTLVSARGLGNKYVEVVFSEPMDSATANDSFNYEMSSLSGLIGANAAVQLADPTRVLLTLASPMPCEYMTLTVNNVTDQSPLNNVIAPNSQTRFMNFTPTSLKHRYTFNEGSGNAPSGSVMLDGVGTSDGAVLGAGAQFTGDRVTIPGGSSLTAAYIDLPNGLLSVNGVANGGSGEVSLEGWFRNTGNHNWARIFDFGSSITGEVPGPGGGGEGRDYFMLSAQNGGDTGSRRTELRNEDPGGGGTFTVDHATADFNQDTHFVVTWRESNGQIRTYANGALVSTMTVPTRMSDINDVNVWLGRSNWTGDENAQGEFDEFRIYNKVLSPAEITVNRAMGPDNQLGAPVALRMGTPSLMNVGQSLLPSVFADFASVSNVDVGLAGCARYLSSAPGVIGVPGGTRLLGVGGGTSTITAQFNGLSANAVFTVNFPPTPGTDGAATPQDRPVRIVLSKLLLNDTDPESNYPLTITGVNATSANGGAVVMTSSNLTYTPPAGFHALDQVTYFVTDSRGGTAAGLVQVMVVDGNLPGANQVSITPTPGGPTIRFAGIPGYTYQIQRSTNPAGPWTTLAVRVAPVFGLIDFQDTNPPMPTGFYRAVVQ